MVKKYAALGAVYLRLAPFQFVGLSDSVIVELPAIQAQEIDTNFEY